MNRLPYASCITQIIFLLLYIAFATYATDQVLEMMNIHIHWIGDMLLGIAIGWIIIWIYLILLLF